MKKLSHKIRLTPLFCAISLLVFSCKAVTENTDKYKTKDKNVLVYMIGNNSLSDNATDNLNSILRGYIPSDEGYLLVYYHNKINDPVLLQINNNKGVTVVDTLYKFPARNSALALSLKQTINIATTLCPAKEYGLILWSHGTGWLPSDYYSSGTITPSAVSQAGPEIKMAQEGMLSLQSFGSEESKEIEITDLATALPHRFSYIIFDACLMGGIETAYELKDSADYIMFSPTEILSSGFPYGKIMQHLFASETDLKSVAEEYYNFYNSMSGKSQSGTITLLKTSELNKVADIAKEIFDTNRDKIASLNMQTIQPYFRTNKHWFYDIQDFIDNIASLEKSAEFKTALENAIVYKAHTNYFISLRIDKYSGISTYIPNPANEELDNFYKNFAWNKAAEMIQ